MPTVFYSQDEYQLVEAKLYRAVKQCRDLEAMRPHWAMGHTSDSVAAQAAYTALNQLRDMLGATTQTQAVEALRVLISKANGFDS